MQKYLRPVVCSPDAETVPEMFLLAIKKNVLLDKKK